MRIKIIVKIAVITSPFGELPPDAIGAVEKLFYLLAGEWAKVGHDVCFICVGGGDNGKIRHVRLKKYRRTGSTKKDLLWDFLYSVKAMLKCPKTDILFCNTFWSPFLAPLFRWKYKRLVYGVHRYPKGQFFLYPFAHGFICVSTAVADALRRELGDDSRIAVINNPIDTDVFSKAAGACAKDCVVAYAGRIHPEKGLDILFEACERLACDVKLSIRLFGAYDVAGGGGGEVYVEHLKSMAPHVLAEFRGAMYDPCALAAALRDCMVFVYPSVADKGEALPVAPLEAMGLGLPVVLSDLACFSDYAVDKENCQMFHRGGYAVEECAAALQSLLSDCDLRVRLGEHAASTAVNFSAGNIARKYLEKFDEDLRDVRRWRG